MSFQNKSDIAINTISFNDALRNNDIPGAVASATGAAAVNPNKAVSLAISIAAVQASVTPITNNSINNK